MWSIYRIVKVYTTLHKNNDFNESWKPVLFLFFAEYTILTTFCSATQHLSFHLVHFALVVHPELIPPNKLYFICISLQLFFLF